MSPPGRVSPHAWPGDLDTGTLDDFHERYVVHEKTEGGSFMERLQEQLEGAPDETIH